MCTVQAMFVYASAFDQPVDSWNMGQVTTTTVRRAPLEPHGL